MDPDIKRNKKTNLPSTDADTSEHIILNPAESKVQAQSKVIWEDSKKDIPGTEAGDESDLDAFERQWDANGGSHTAGEYHKQGAPYMEEQIEQDGPQPRMRKILQKSVGEELHPGKDSPGNTGSTKSGEKAGFFDNLSEKVTGKETDVPTKQTLTKKPFTQRVLDISTIEVLAYTVFRAIFGKGVRIPLKIAGSMDMDIAVKDTDVIINTNDVTFEPPKLQIWHFIIAYKGKPVLEYGRGVERIKIHYYRAFVMLIAAWWGGKKKRKAKMKSDKAADNELARYAAGNIKPNDKKGAG